MLGRSLVRALAGSRAGEHARAAEATLRWGYHALRSQRAHIRSVLGAELKQYAAEPSERGAPGAVGMLRVVRSIVLGLGLGADTRTASEESSASASASAFPSSSLSLTTDADADPDGSGAAQMERVLVPLLRDVLMPLYLPLAMANELTPLLGLYHRDLARALMATCDRCPGLCVEALAGLANAMPEGKQGASKKVPLLFRSMETLLTHRVPPSSLEAAFRAVLPSLAIAVGSDHASSQQRALQVFSNEGVMDRIREQPRVAGLVARFILPSLLQGGRPSWDKGASQMRRAAAAALTDACGVAVGYRGVTSASGGDDAIAASRAMWMDAARRSCAQTPVVP